MKWRDKYGTPDSVVDRDGELAFTCEGTTPHADQFV
jgi:hypothetical protein